MSDLPSMSPNFLADILRANDMIHKRAMTVARLLGLRPTSIRFNRRSKKAFVAFCLSDGGLRTFYKSIPVAYLGMEDADILADWSVVKGRSLAHHIKLKKKQHLEALRRAEAIVTYRAGYVDKLQKLLRQAQEDLESARARLALLQSQT